MVIILIGKAGDQIGGFKCCVSREQREAITFHKGLKLCGYDHIVVQINQSKMLCSAIWGLYRTN